ncbi:MAG: hypothetical protein U5K56_15670 [Halioglobus sp.]|nr:hypothetical protein [Halioglobus sp.]
MAVRLLQNLLVRGVQFEFHAVFHGVALAHALRQGECDAAQQHGVDGTGFQFEAVRAGAQGYAADIPEAHGAVYEFVKGGVDEDIVMHNALVDIELCFVDPSHFVTIEKYRVSGA